MEGLNGRKFICREFSTAIYVADLNEHGAVVAVSQETFDYGSLTGCCATDRVFLNCEMVALTEPGDLEYWCDRNVLLYLPNRISATWGSAFSLEAWVKARLSLRERLATLTETEVPA